MRLEYLLNLKEVLSALIDTDTLALDRLDSGKYGIDMKNYYQSIFENAYNWDFTTQGADVISTMPFMEWDSDNNKYVMTKHGLTILNYIFRQYGDSYCAKSQNDNSGIVGSCIAFFDTFITRLEETYQKYSALLSYYEEYKTKLMNDVKSGFVDTSSASSNGGSTNISKFKDTPETEVSLEDLGDDYNSNVTISEGSDSSSSSGSVRHDSFDEKDTAIKRLDEIKEYYSKVIQSWGNEFKEMLWEEIV